MKALIKALFSVILVILVLFALAPSAQAIVAPGPDAMIRKFSCASQDRFADGSTYTVSISEGGLVHHMAAQIYLSRRDLQTPANLGGFIVARQLSQGGAAKIGLTLVDIRTKGQEFNLFMNAEPVVGQDSMGRLTARTSSGSLNTAVLCKRVVVYY